MSQTSLPEAEVDNTVGLDDHLARMRDIQGQKATDEEAERQAFHKIPERHAASMNLRKAIKEYVKATPEIGDVIRQLEWALGELKDQQIIERTKR